MNDKTISVPGITLCWVTSFCVDLAWHLNSLILSMTMVWLIQQAHWAATSSVRLWHLRMTTLENNVCPIVKLRSRFQVRSRSSPRSGPEGPRSKVQRPGPGLYIKLSSSGPGQGPRSGPGQAAGQVPGQVQQVQGLRPKTWTWAIH